MFDVTLGFVHAVFSGVHPAPHQSLRLSLTDIDKVLSQDFSFGGFGRVGVREPVGGVSVGDGAGVVALEDVVAEAGANGFRLDGIVAMPANNLSVVLRKL